MNWKFWESKEYKPSLVERVAAYHWSIRIAATLPLLAIIAAIIWFVLSINLEGVQLIQATDKIAKIMEVGTIIPTVALVVIVAFIGMTGGARAELVIISMLATAFLTTAYEGVQVWKSRAATIIEQDIGAENHDDAEKAINARIKTAQESADFYKTELTKAQNRKCFKWEQLKCDENVSKNNEAFQKKGDIVAALQAEKLNLPKKKPTESSILGRELSQFMAGALVVILLAIKSICSTLLGAIVASFSIHKTKKYVPENTRAEAIKRREEQPVTPEEYRIRDLTAGKKIPPPPAPPKRQLQQDANDAPPPPVAPDPIDLSDAARDLTNVALTGLTVATAFPAHASDAVKEPVALISQTEKAPENAQVVPSSGLVAPSSTSVAVESATSSTSVAFFDESATEPVAPSSAFSEPGSSSVAPLTAAKSEEDLFNLLNGGVPMTIPTIQEFMACDADTARELRKVMRSRGISDRVSLDVVRREIEAKKSNPQSVESASS